MLDQSASLSVVKLASPYVKVDQAHGPSGLGNQESG